MFTDRTDAGRRLAAALRGCMAARPVVLALPRGGVPVAAEIAAALDAPLDLVIARKIGLPQQPELAMGAVVDGDSPIILRNDDVIAEFGIDDATFAAACAAELVEIERRRDRYLRDRPRIDVRGRATIMVDDGIATGATARAALRAVRRRHPTRLVLAVPVGPRDTLREMRDEVDAIVCLERPTAFSAIGAFYRDFRQVDDDEVIATLVRFPAG